MTTSTWVLLALIPLILWRLYSRYRRLVSRQKSRAWRHWAAAIFFPGILRWRHVNAGQAAVTGGTP